MDGALACVIGAGEADCHTLQRPIHGKSYPLPKKYSDNNFVKVKSVFWKNCTKIQILVRNEKIRVEDRKNLSTILVTKKWEKWTYTRNY